MSERIHLGSVTKPEGTVWFTLIVENPKDFYVELYNDSSQPFVKERLKTIRTTDFGKYEINGIPLTKIIAERLQEKNFQSR